jgi:hypothetical protein
MNATSKQKFRVIAVPPVIETMLTGKRIQFWECEWRELEGVKIVGVKGCKWWAFPVNNRKNCRTYQTFHIDTREPGPQLKRGKGMDDELTSWLIRVARDENVPCTGTM